MYFYSGLGLRPLSGLYLEELNKGKIMFEWNGFNYWAAEHYDFKVVQGTEEHCLAIFRAEQMNRPTKNTEQTSWIKSTTKKQMNGRWSSDGLRPRSFTGSIQSFRRVMLETMERYYK